MKTDYFRAMSWLGLFAAGVFLYGCGGGGDGAAPASQGTTVDAAGATIDGPGGVQVVIPAGALTTRTTINVAPAAGTLPSLPPDVVAGPIFEITPHGQTFAVPIKIRIPYTGTAEADGRVMVAEPGGTWTPTSATFANGYAEVERTSLSYYFAFSSLFNACRVPAGSTDPHPCRWTQIGPGTLTTTPPGAITTISLGNNVVGPAFTRAATAELPINISAAPDCTNGRLNVYRLSGASAGLQHVLQNQAVALSSPGPGQKLVGLHNFQFSVSAADNAVSGPGRLFFSIQFACTRAFGNQLSLDTLNATYNVLILPPSPPPTITQHPQNAAVSAGAALDFDLLATATAGLTVTWQRSNDGGATWSTPTAGANIAGGSRLSLTAQLADNGALFRANVCNGSGPTQTCIDSSIATLTVAPPAGPPTIQSHPSAQSFTAGGAAIFSVVASGTGTLQYQWRRNNIDLPAGAFTDGACSGAATGTTTAVLSLSGLTAGCAGSSFTVVVSNGSGSTASNAATLSLSTAPPTITQVVVSQAVDVGQQATFTVGATGTDLTYQWQRAPLGGLPADIPGATSATYLTPPANVADDGSTYQVFVCSGPRQNPALNCFLVSGVNNEIVTLTINPIVSQQFAVIPSGTQASLKAVAFANATTGVAVGDGGTIVRTTDGGQTWTPVNSTTTVDLRRVALGGSGHGLAVGPNTILYTADNGATWSANNLGFCSSAFVPCDVAYASPTVAWVATGANAGQQFGGFARLTGGGQTYDANFGTQVPFPFLVRFASRFASPSVGVGSAGGGQLYFTADGGLTWTAATQPASVGAFAAAFASGTVAVAGGFGGVLMRSTNGGSTWSALYGGGEARPSGALAFNATGVGLSVGGGQSFYGSYAMMRTPDHGITWVPLELPGHTDPSLNPDMNDIAFADDNVAVAVGGGGLIIRFTAGGL